MALDSETIEVEHDRPTSIPFFGQNLTFDGDAAYAAGGSANFTAFVQSIQPGRTVLAVIPGDCGIFVPVYVPETDKLKVYRRDTGAEAANGDLSGTVFNLAVISY